MSKTAMGRRAPGLGTGRKPEPVDPADLERRIDRLLGGGRKGGA